MIVEMRTHKTKPGLRPRFLEIFRSRAHGNREENPGPVSFRRETPIPSFLCVPFPASLRASR